MFKELIYKGEKVFSAEFLLSDPIEPVLNKIKQHDDVGTGVLLLEEGQESLLSLFILENHFYTPYRLTEGGFVPLHFSDYLKEMDQLEGKLGLYQVSPVLFKALLMLAQHPPSVLGTNEVIDVKRLFVYANDLKKEAVIVLKKKKKVDLFYFLEGVLRDAYLEESGELENRPVLKEKLLLCAERGDDPVHIAFFDQTRIFASVGDDAASEHAVCETGDAFSASSPYGDGFSCLRGEMPWEGGVVEDREEVTGDSEKHVPAHAAIEKETPPADRLFPKNGKDLWVKVLSGSRAGFLIRAALKPVSLGRGNVTVRLNDPQISRFHAQLEWLDYGLTIRDNHSTNGLFVNNEKVSQKDLMLHDVIQLGEVSLKVVLAS